MSARSTRSTTASLGASLQLYQQTQANMAATSAKEGISLTGSQTSTPTKAKDSDANNKISDQIKNPDQTLLDSNPTDLNGTPTQGSTKAPQLPPYTDISKHTTVDQDQPTNSNVSLLDEFRKEFGKLREDINRDFQESKQDYNQKLLSMEEKLLLDQHNKFVELVDIFNTHKEEVNDEVKVLKDSSNKFDSSVENLKSAHKEEIERLMCTISDKEAKLLEIESRLNDHILTTSNKFQRVQEGVDEARGLANSVEAHGRRWAIRIIGLVAPPIKPESTEVAKEIVVKFLKERLNILSVETSDVDCAHRLGHIKNGKQIILTRFFRRDLADHAIRNKKMLKGTGMAVFEDSP
jgi:hypothetical protein